MPGLPWSSRWYREDSIAQPIWTFAAARCCALGGLLLSSQLVLAQNPLLDIGYTALQGQLGSSIPKGAGVAVSQVENSESSSSSIYSPTGNAGTSSNPHFTGKTFSVLSGSTTVSSHAQGVAANFYGNLSSVAPGVTQIQNYSVVANPTWFTSVLRSQLSASPFYSSNVGTRVTNHSWVGSYSSTSQNLDVLLRTDWLVSQDDSIQVVGVNNGNSIGNPIMMTGALNTISVGVAGGNHTRFTSPAIGNAIYEQVHPRPDLVAPGYDLNFTSQYATSFATPYVSGAAAMLISAAKANPSWSITNYNSPRSNAGNGGFVNISAAETSEVIKASLLAGATRSYVLADNSAKLVDWRSYGGLQTTNGLDNRYGAGLLNVRNSYEILAGTQQRSQQDGNANDISQTGFDYDRNFGGSNSSNTTATYEFNGGWTGQQFSASLVWNVEIDMGNVIGSNQAEAATLRDLNLRLYDITGGGNILVQQSVSTTENNENLFTTLTAGNRYRLEVSKVGADFPWDYGLAWNGTSNILWTGANSGIWDNAISSNWKRGVSASVYRSDDQIVFDDTATNTNVQLVGTILPDIVNFNNTTKNYTLTGTGIGGATQLNKSGTGVLTLSQVNTYAGETAINQGTIRLGVSQALPSNAVLNLSAAGTLDLNGLTQTLGTVLGTGKIALNNGMLNFSNPNNLGFNGSIQGSGTFNKTTNNLLILYGDTTWGNSTINVQTGTLQLFQTTSQTISGGTVWNANVSSGATLQVAGSKSSLSDTSGNRANLSNQGTFLVSGTNQGVGNINGSGTTNVTGLGTLATPTLTANYIRQGALSLGAGATVAITTDPTAHPVVSPKTSILSSLTLGSNARLDLKNNDLIINSVDIATATTTLTQVKNAIISGSAGAWTGAGITTSLATSNTGLGYFHNRNTSNGIILNSFNGLGVDDKSVVVKYTYIGDADLDGDVDDDDYTLFGIGYSTDGIASNPWYYGDFDYDGDTDDDDFTKFGIAYSSNSLPVLSGGGIQIIPEPSTWVLGTLIALGLGMASVRKRRSK